MRYFQVRYNSRVVIYNCRAFISKTTGVNVIKLSLEDNWIATKL